MSGSTNKNKRHAGKEAITYIKQDTVIGLGSGSTVNLMLEELRTETQKGLNISGIPTSLKTEKLAHDLKIPLTNFENAAAIDLAIDGADLVDPNLNLIKGGGGSLLREKSGCCSSQTTDYYSRLVENSRPIRTRNRACRNRSLRPDTRCRTNKENGS